MSVFTVESDSSVTYLSNCTFTPQRFQWFEKLKTYPVTRAAPHPELAPLPNYQILQHTLASVGIDLKELGGSYVTMFEILPRD